MRFIKYYALIQEKTKKPNVYGDQAMQSYKQKFILFNYSNSLIDKKG